MTEKNIKIIKKNFEISKYEILLYILEFLYPAKDDESEKEKKETIWMNFTKKELGEIVTFWPHKDLNEEEYCKRLVDLLIKNFYTKEENFENFIKKIIKILKSKNMPKPELVPKILDILYSKTIDKHIANS